MTVRRVALALVILMIGSTVAVGATTPESTATPDADAPAPLGVAMTEFMQANAAQADGTVGNGLWVAAFARSDNDSERRALVEDRVGSLDASLADLQAERREIQAAYRNGSMDRMTYRARLSAVVGQLAALGDGIEDAGERGRAVGVDETRLDTLRTQARTLGGGEVSRLARNLTGDQDPPGRAGVFDDGPPGRDGDGPPGPPGNDGNGQGPPSDRGPGSSDGNTTATEAPDDGDG